MKRILRLIPLLLCLCTICAVAAAVAADTGQGIQAGHDNVEAAVRRAGKTGTRAEQWAKEREALLDEARRLLFDIEATRFTLSRQQAYISTEQRRIEELSQRLVEAEATRRGLEPVMEALYAELSQAVDTGLPFAMDERQARLVQVRTVLDDPDAAAGDKLGRLLEALRMEAGYGHSLEAEDAVMTVDGAPMAVTLLRVGSLTLLRMPPTGEWIDRYDPASRSWTRLDTGSARPVLKAIRIARKQAMAELVELPIGRMQPEVPATDGVR